LQDEAATQGVDFEELLDQAEFEQEELATRKLVRKSTAATAKGSDAEIINDAGQAGPGAEPAAGAGRMTIQLPHIAARLFDEPLMIDQAQAGRDRCWPRRPRGRRRLFDRRRRGRCIMSRLPAAGRRSRWALVGDPLGRRLDARGEALDVVGQVAIIPVEGSLVHKGAWLGSASGDTSYQGLQTQVARAMNRRTSRAWCSKWTPSAAKRRRVRDRRHDRAIVGGQADPGDPDQFAASAGYLLASAARQIVMPRDGAAGSIGVVSMHADFSKQLEQDGIKVTLIASGKHKTEGNPFQPLAGRRAYPHPGAQRREARKIRRRGRPLSRRGFPRLGARRPRRKPTTARSAVARTWWTASSTVPSRLSRPLSMPSTGRDRPQQKENP
jgi:hypothetical protein